MSVFSEVGVAVIWGITAIGGLVVIVAVAVSWRRRRTRSRPASPEVFDVNRWYEERERRETRRRIAAAEYRQRTRHEHDDEE